MSSTATVSDKGQITLPKQLRDQLGIGPGSRLALSVLADGGLRVQLLATGSSALAGLLARPGDATRSLADMDAAVTSAVTGRARR